jgi:hypothetical protein
VSGLYVCMYDYIFEPFGVETLGSWGPGARSLFKEIAQRLVDASRDQKAGSFCAQRNSIAIQHGNADSFLGKGYGHRWRGILRLLRILRIFSLILRIFLFVDWRPTRQHGFGNNSF